LLHIHLHLINTIDFSNPKEKKMHDALVVMVDKILKLHRKALTNEKKIIIIKI